jgi:hypothetical protein
LEERFRDRGPTLDEVQKAWGQIAERARAKFRGEPAPEGEQTRDRDIIDRWAKSEGVDLEGGAERAKQKLRNVDRPQT